MKRLKNLIREIKKQEYNLLDDFLYEAIFIPEGVEVPSKEITNQPDFQIYIADFGKQNDNCLVAECNGKIVGAVWTRIINDYGHIDNETPSLAISLFKEYRSLGIGTALMNRMIELLKSKGYKRVSLSVQKENYAYNLYKKVGFEIIKENDEDFIMVKQL